MKFINMNSNQSYYYVAPDTGNHYRIKIYQYTPDGVRASVTRFDDEMTISAPVKLDMSAFVGPTKNDDHDRQIVFNRIIRRFEEIIKDEL